MPTNASLNPNVRVLVLSYNGRQLLQECLDSYIDNDYDNFAITVIDNGSTDDTRQLWSSIIRKLICYICFKTAVIQAVLMMA